MTPVTDLELLEQKAAKQRKAHQQMLSKTSRSQLLRVLPEAHQEVFNRIDCLTCANCCRNYSPRFKGPDIKRIARRLRMKESAFIEAYLVLDPDGDYVVNSRPCPFLGEDHYCRIYEDRPRDCARYPYTDEDVFIRQVRLSLKNISVCPAAYAVAERLLESFRPG